MLIVFDDPFLTDAQVSDLTGVSKDKLAKLRVTGEGARYVKIGRAIRYRRSAVEAWLSQLERRSTSDGGSSADRAA
jgi:excisionase family DNA binding protein